jgi:putative membrane protein insertion efficiency factor
MKAAAAASARSAALGALIRRLFVLPIRLYQKVISPLLPRSCIYTPTCSHYALEAVRRHGVLAGSAAAVARLLRCVGSLYVGGDDAVPDRVTWRSLVEPYGRFWRFKRRR